MSAAVQTSGVRVLGFYGMGGVGKSTLATAVFDRLSQSGKFYRSCFVPDIRDRVQQQDGAENLQQKMLKSLSNYDQQPQDAVCGNDLHAPGWLPHPS